MAALRQRLRTELSHWFERLPLAWQPLLEGVQLDFAAVDPDAELDDNNMIWPQEQQHDAPADAHLFKALKDLAPHQIRIVIFGNDPYTKLHQATGRSFEQGGLEDWHRDIRFRRRISPSLQTILAAAAATSPTARGYSLADRRMAYDDYEAEKLRQPIWFCHVELARALADNAVEPKPPQDIFGSWAEQGVLWLNRTLTYTKWDDDHRESHQRLWAPFTARMLKILVEQCRQRRVVFVMWGSSADDLEDDIRDHQQRLGVPEDAAAMAKAGHPQWPAGHFRAGNPLEQINTLLGETGPPISWI